MAERLRPSDGQRVARALEVIRSTGRSLATWQATSVDGPLTGLDRQGGVAKFVLLPPRDWLYERCHRRFDLMIEAGALDEVAALPALHPATKKSASKRTRNAGACAWWPHLTALKALGVPQLRAALTGEMAMDDAVALAKTATRQYAKRQMTWFRNQCRDWGVIDEKESERFIDIIFSKISVNGLTE